MRKIIIDSKNSFFQLDLRELLSYKDLFLTLAYRDIKVRYAHTFLGVTWTVLQPLANLLIFILVFGMAMKIDTGGTPYALHALCGLCGWTYFSTVISQSGSAIIGQQNLIQKIYFPRIILPFSKAIAALLDLAISLALLLIALVYYHFTPPSQVVFLPLFILFTFMITISVNLWLSALTVRFRDFQYIIPFLVQFGLYATPIAYPVRLIPAKFQFIYAMNPMSGLIEGYRWCVLGDTLNWQHQLVSAAMTVLLFIGGFIYFKRVEHNIADII